MGVPVDEHCTVFLKQVSSMRGEEPRIPRMKIIFCSVQFLYNWGSYVVEYLAGRPC